MSEEVLTEEQLFFEFAPLPGIVLETDGTIRALNSQARLLFGDAGQTPTLDALIPFPEDRNRLLSFCRKPPQQSGIPVSLRMVDIQQMEMTYHCFISRMHDLVYLILQQPDQSAIQCDTDFLQQNLAVTDAGVAVLNCDYQFVNTNLAWMRLLSYDHNEMEKLRLWDILFSEDFLRFKQQLKRLEEGYTDHFSIEQRYVRSDGSAHWGIWAISAIKKDSAADRRLMIVLTGIEHIKETEWRLRFDNEFFKILIDAIPSGVFWRDKHGYFMGCNEAFEEFFGFSSDLLAWQTIADVFPEEQSDRLLVFDQMLLDNPGVRETEIKLKTVDGLVREFIFISAVYYDIDPLIEGFIGQDEEDRQVEGFIGILIDITIRKKAEYELKESYERIKEQQDEILDLERKNMALAMAATANHEINQPLMVLKGNLDLMKMMLPGHVMTGKIPRYMDRIEESMERIKKILDRYKSAEDFHLSNYSQSSKIIEFTDNKDD